ncbi:conserved hypothetical protein [Agrobacterium fabacearum TT111]|nr:conserved hypothetical protein [Agrobacterium fabacearum TT111]
MNGIGFIIHSSEGKSSACAEQSALTLGEPSGLKDGAGVTDMLNKQVLEGKIKSLVIIAAPRTLGEMRKSYHKSLSDVLIGELDKDLTGHSVQDIEKALAVA